VSSEARTCYASGDPHFRSFAGYFNNFETGWRRFYALNGNKVLVYQSKTDAWGDATTIKKVSVTTAGGRRFKFEVTANPCKAHLRHGSASALSSWGNGFQFRGANGFNVRLNAGCQGNSVYTNLEVDDKSTKTGFGFCFRRGHKLPRPPKKCKGGLRRAKRACRRVRCHRGIFASCVDDICANGHKGSIAAHLKRLSKARNGKPCKRWKGLKRYGKHRKACFTSCKTIWNNCLTAARCARKLSGRSYRNVCKKRRGQCRTACRKNWRKARKCIIGCFRKQRGCRQLARCAAGIVNLKYICKRRGHKCAAQCFTSISKN